MDYNALYMEVKRIYISLHQECTVYDVYVRVCSIYIYMHLCMHMQTQHVIFLIAI